MKDATKHVLERKAEMEGKRNIHDVAAASVDAEKRQLKNRAKNIQEKMPIETE